MIPKVKELSQSEVDALLKAPDGRTRQGKRAAAILAVMVRTGVRRGELCKLLLEDFTDGPLPSLRVKTLKQKNGKEPYRTIPLGRETAQLIGKYLKARGEAARPLSPLFLTLRSYNGAPKAITHTALHRLLLKALDKAKISRRIRCHTFRHHFATATHETGSSVATVSQLLGHASSRTTDTYLNASDQRKRQAISNAFGGR